MSDEQVRIILGVGVKEVVIAMDKDVPIEEVWSMCEKFYGLRKVSYIYDEIWWFLVQKIRLQMQKTKFIKFYSNTEEFMMQKCIENI